MRISGFTFMRNTSSLYYPFIESILSILPIVDEFIIALGDNAEEDTTEISLMKIDSPKIKIIHTVWDLEKYPRGTIYAQQTNLAKKHCSGDWLFYLQSDEVIHEKYHHIILEHCKKNLYDLNIEGLLFSYIHFYGDYQHHMQNHAWYSHEIRIVRNLTDIHSFSDAQSFRYIQHFDEKNFRQKNNGRPLNVAIIPAVVFHYGWVRPPSMMQNKTVNMKSHYNEQHYVEYSGSAEHNVYDYGNMNLTTSFLNDHPSIMKEFISRFNWAHQLHFEKQYTPKRPLVKHERMKYRFLSWIENHLLKGRKIFGYRNWKIIKMN